MKFGKLLRSQMLQEQEDSSSWRYLNYDKLKEMIRVGVDRAEFDTALTAEMKAVDDCYGERFLSFDDVFDDGCGQDVCGTASKLRQFVVL